MSYSTKLYQHPSRRNGLGLRSGHSTIREVRRVLFLLAVGFSIGALSVALEIVKVFA